MGVESSYFVMAVMTTGSILVLATGYIGSLLNVILILTLYTQQAILVIDDGFFFFLLLQSELNFVKWAIQGDSDIHGWFPNVRR